MPYSCYCKNFYSLFKKEQTSLVFYLNLLITEFSLASIALSVHWLIGLFILIFILSILLIVVCCLKKSPRDRERHQQRTPRGKRTRRPAGGGTSQNKKGSKAPPQKSANRKNPEERDRDPADGSLFSAPAGQPILNGGTYVRADDSVERTLIDQPDYCESQQQVYPNASNYASQQLFNDLQRAGSMDMSNTPLLVHSNISNSSQVAYATSYVGVGGNSIGCATPNFETVSRLSGYPTPNIEMSRLPGYPTPQQIMARSLAQSAQVTYRHPAYTNTTPLMKNSTLPIQALDLQADGTQSAAHLQRQSSQPAESAAAVATVSNYGTVRRFAPSLHNTPNVNAFRFANGSATAYRTSLVDAQYATGLNSVNPTLAQIDPECPCNTKSITYNHMNSPVRRYPANLMNAGTLPVCAAINAPMNESQFSETGDPTAPQMFPLQTLTSTTQGRLSTKLQHRSIPPAHVSPTFLQTSTFTADPVLVNGPPTNQSGRSSGVCSVSTLLQSRVLAPSPSPPFTNSTAGSVESNPRTGGQPAPNEDSLPTTNL